MGGHGSEIPREVAPLNLVSSARNKEGRTEVTDAARGHSHLQQVKAPGESACPSQSSQAAVLQDGIS